MIVIHYPTAYKALDRFIDAFNEKTEKYASRLRTGAVATAKELIRIYGIALLKANGLAIKAGEALPSLKTNNVQLARLIKCSERTVQRHIIKLQAAGIITDKVWHGSNSGYELWINPIILLIKGQLPVNKDQDALQQDSTKRAPAAFLREEKTNCRHTYTSYTSNINNNIVIAVDKPLPTASGYSAGNTGEIALPDENKKNETGEIASRAAASGHRNVASDLTARDNFLSFYVGLFWMTARNLLYAKKDLTARQVVIAKRYIQKFYEPVPKEKISKVHSGYIERICLAAKFVQKDPDKRFIPLPYIYFDTQNPNGFTGTKQWLIAEENRKRQTLGELTLSRAIRKFTGNGPYPQKPSLHIFRECENTLGKLRDPILMDRFYAAVLEHQTYLNISPFKPKTNTHA